MNCIYHGTIIHFVHPGQADVHFVHFT